MRNVPGRDIVQNGYSGAEVAPYLGVTTWCVTRAVSSGKGLERKTVFGSYVRSAPMSRSSVWSAERPLTDLHEWWCGRTVSWDQFDPKV